jgi:hypothetical protein
MSDALDHRCGSCARFVRVFESIDANGVVKRAGECLLGVWPSPLYETSTCSQWVRRGEFRAAPAPRQRVRRAAQARSRTGSDRDQTAGAESENIQPSAVLVLPEDLLDMDADEFRRVLAEVVRDELGVGEVEIAGRWEGGEMILKPGKDGTQEKRIPLDTLFHKIVLIRDKLRVLEQRINGNPKLAADEKVQLQQYITGCYGSLTTFNVLFASREDGFVGQKGDE